MCFDVLIKWTGHKDYNAMKPYIAIADNVKKEMMARFNPDEKLDQ